MENLVNDFTTQLDGAIDDSQTSIDVLANASVSANFRIRVDNELMLVTANGSTTWTVTRGVEGTAAASHLDGVDVDAVITAAGLAQWADDRFLTPAEGTAAYDALGAADTAESNANSYADSTFSPLAHEHDVINSGAHQVFVGATGIITATNAAGDWTLFTDGNVYFSGDIIATGAVSGSNLSGTNTGDQDLSAYALTSALSNYVPTSYLDTDGTLAANSDSKLATQKATKTYADTKVLGPGTVVDNQVVRFNGTTGLLIQGSILSIDDTGVMTLSGTSATPARFVITKDAGQAGTIDVHTAGVLHWRVGANNSAESGSNVGSDFQVAAFGDAGASIDTPILITRAAGGSMTLARPVLLGSTLTLASVVHTTVREQLQAGRTYYVRTDGSDSNNGLSDNSGGAFLTIQHAADVAFNLDLNNNSVSIYVRAGTYATVSVLSRQVGLGDITLIGDTTTPGNVVIAGTSDHAVSVNGGGTLSVEGFKFTTSGTGYGLYANERGTINMSGNCEFGACASAHIYTVRGGVVNVNSDYLVSAASPFHVRSDFAGQIISSGHTVTITGTPAFTIFAVAQRLAILYYGAMTFSGSATGTRYYGDSNALIDSAGGGATYFPGDAGGSTDGTAVYQ